MKRLALTLAAVLSIALSGTSMAANQTGSTPESLSVLASISLTVPTSADYGTGKSAHTIPLSVTATTDNTTGMDVYVQVNAGGAGKITPGSRAFALPVVTAACEGGILLATGAPLAEGSIVAATDYRLIGTSAANACTSTWDSTVNASAYAPGSYTGTLSFSATTRP